MSEINITEENANVIHEHIVYAAAVVANIRSRLDKFHECYIDDKDIVKMWSAPWLSATGNLHDRIKRLAKEMNANVSWPKKGEARFTRKIPFHIIGE